MNTLSKYQAFECFEALIKGQMKFPSVSFRTHTQIRTHTHIY